MKFLLLFTASGLAAWLLGPFAPYWGVMLVIAVFASLVGGNGLMAFFSGALGMGGVWLLVTLLTTLNNETGFPLKIARIMGFEDELTLVGITFLLGFLIGGLGALTGNRFRKLSEKDRSDY